MVILFLLSLLSFSSIASVTCDSDGLNTHIELNEFNNNLLEIIKEEKPWSAASNEDVQNAKCRKKIPSLKKMKKYLDKEYNKKEKITLNGIILIDDKRIIQALDKLINKEKSFFSKDELKTDLSSDKFKECKTALCISEKLFGKKLGTKLLYMISRYGLNGSHLVFKDARAWGEDELDSYLQGIQDLPSFILPMNNNKMCIHDKEENGKTMANASITFFAGLDDKDKEEKEYTTYHELSHYISGELEIDHNPEWLALSGWDVDLIKKWEIEKAIKKSKETNTSFSAIDLTKKPISIFDINKPKNTFDLGYPSVKTKDMFANLDKNLLEIQIFHKAMVPKNKDNIISEYGETNPAEDFAETMSAYRFKPELLKEISPKKYEFIKKNVFGGIEFTSKRKCRDSNSIFFQHLKDAKNWKTNSFENKEEQKKDYLLNLEIDENEKERIKNAILNYSL